MSIGDITPIIQLILSHTIVATGIKGLFDIIKNYFDLKKQIAISSSESDKSKNDSTKVGPPKVNWSLKDGDKEYNMKFTTFDENERKLFFDMIDKVYSNK